MPNKDRELESKLIHGVYDKDAETGATNPPIHMSAAFAHDSAEQLSNVFHGREFGYVYSRIANPSIVALEQHINLVEDGRAAVATASGMAAMAILIETLAGTGDEIISSKSIFGGTYYLLKEVAANQGITVRYVDTCDLAQYKAAINDKTRAIFCESIGNPKCDVPDLKSLAALATEAGIPLVVDATVSTPFLMSAKALGVHVVWHSATKWISGTGTSIGGLIVDLGHFDWRVSKSKQVATLAKQFGLLAFVNRCKRLRSNKGAALSPLNAFLLGQGFEHLALRMKQHCENALSLARFLTAHKAVQSVSYPGLEHHIDYEIAKAQMPKGCGGLLSFRLKDKVSAFKLVKQLKMAKNLSNLGDAKTLVIHPSSTIYRELSEEDQQQAGVYDDLIRVSVGLEAFEDIKYDFEQALEGLV
eukprot:COSAG01_NODE_236_length_20742_cov_2129.910236_8_plen_417_part_00